VMGRLRGKPEKSKWGPPVCLCCGYHTVLRKKGGDGHDRP